MSKRHLEREARKSGRRVLSVKLFVFSYSLGKKIDCLLK